MKRIIISDTHIGSKFFKGKELLNFLKNEYYDQLILAGDIIDFIKVPEFDKISLELMSAIDFSKEIIYIVGNHDVPLKGFVGQKAFGLTFVDKYEFEENNVKFRIEHGDKYDESMLVHHNLFMNFLSVFQKCIEHFFDINLSKAYTNYKFRNRNIKRILEVLQTNEDINVFIMGHFHIPEVITWNDHIEQNKTYINSGDWVSHTTYVEIINGDAKLKEYDFHSHNIK